VAKQRTTRKPKPTARARVKPTPIRRAARRKAPAKRGLPAFDFAGLERALLSATRTSFAKLRDDHPDHHFYCMALYTAGELGYMFPTAMSEEGLTEVVASYRQKPRYASRTEAQLRDQLRWSPADSPHHEEVGDEETFAPVNARLNKLALVLRGIDTTTSWDTFHAFVARAHDSVFNVLHRLDGEGCFGTGAAREQIFVSMMMGDQDRSVLALGERLNPASTLERYRAQAFG
jgi:hypothetical protein